MFNPKLVVDIHWLFAGHVGVAYGANVEGSLFVRDQDDRACNRAVVHEGLQQPYEIGFGLRGSSSVECAGARGGNPVLPPIRTSRLRRKWPGLV